jgi:hypothetical protein
MERGADCFLAAADDIRYVAAAAFAARRDLLICAHRQNANGKRRISAAVPSRNRRPDLGVH